MAELLDQVELPNNFHYPKEFLRVVNLGLTDLEPWLIFDGDALRRRNQGLRERFPERSLVPFARRQDNDDIACWDVAQASGVVVIVHDFASPGWERRAEYTGFNEWFRQAIEDMLAFDRS